MPNAHSNSIKLINNPFLFFFIFSSDLDAFYEGSHLSCIYNFFFSTSFNYVIDKYSTPEQGVRSEQLRFNFISPESS